MSRAWAVGFFSMAALLGAQSSYTGAKVCAGCHPAESRRQLRSEHARALYAARDHPLAGEFTPSGVLHRPPRFDFRFSLTAEHFQVQLFDDKDVMEIPIEWAFGAGAQAVTFVSRVNADWYLEHFFTYYPAVHRMSITPGQEAREANSIAEAAGLMYKALDPNIGILRCFECHSTGRVRTSNGVLRPAENGVRCEACHGPGESHARSGDPKLIRNPKKMQATELNVFCGECHRPPASSGTRIDWNYPWNVRHQPVYLSQSACFLKSNGALSCLSCHRPHEALERNASYYNSVCRSCHSVAHKAARMANCIDCHMPQVSPQPPLKFTNHWIGIYGKGAMLRPIAASH